MDILQTLRDRGISKIKFVLDFNLSRPTFDEYIKKYESGESLPKGKYQIIFDSLFSKELSTEEFSNRYNSFKDLMKRDKIMKLDNLDPVVTDDIIQILSALKEEAEETEQKSELIPFIKYLSINYHNNRIVDILVKYFNYLNGLIDNVDFASDDKKYVGCFYHINDALLNNSELLNEISDKYYQDYLAKRKELLARNNKQTKDIKEKISSLIDNYVNQAVADSNGELSNEEIVKKVLSKIAISND